MNHSIDLIRWEESYVNAYYYSTYVISFFLRLMFIRNLINKSSKLSSYCIESSDSNKTYTSTHLFFKRISSISTCINTEQPITQFQPITHFHQQALKTLNGLRPTKLLAIIGFFYVNIAILWRVQ